MAKKEQVTIDLNALVNDQYKHRIDGTDGLKDVVIDFRERGGDNDDLVAAINALLKKNDWAYWRLFSDASTARIVSVITDFSAIEGPIVSSLCSLMRPEVVARAISLGAPLDYPSRYEPTLVSAAKVDANDFRRVSDEEILRRYAASVEISRMLIEAGLDLDVSNESGVTPLMAAARCGNCELVDLLLKAGADFRRQDASGLSALHHATLGGLHERSTDFLDDRVLKSIKLLIEAGANPRMKTFIGQTPLHTLALSSNKTMSLYRAERIVEALVAAGSDIESKNREGLTPLLLAVRTGSSHEAVVPALMLAGADIEAKTMQGSTITRLGNAEVKRKIKSILLANKMADAMSEGESDAPPPSSSPSLHGVL